MPNLIPVPYINNPEIKMAMFLSSHPECNLMTQDNIISIMIKNKVINKKEAETLKSKLPQLIDQFEKTRQQNKFKNNSNISLKEVEAKQTSTPLKIPNFHKTFTDLIIKDNGQIDMSQFDINEIKKRFHSDEYNVLVKKNIITILDNTGKEIASITFPPKLENTVIYNVITEDGKRNYSIKNGKVTQFSTFYQNSSKNIFYHPNGQIDQINYFNRVKLTNRNIIYSGGYPFEEVVEGHKKRNLLVEDLYKDITAKNKIGLPTTRKSINKNVLKRINNDNVYIVLNEYKKNYGSDLLEDINSEIGLKKDFKMKLINHIKTCMKNSTSKSAERAGEYIATRLADDIYGIGSGNLEADVFLIDKNNVGYVSRKYYEIAKEKHKEACQKHAPFNIPFTNIVISPAEAIAPIEGLIESIDMELGLDIDVSKKLIEHIKDCALKCGYITQNSTYYTKDIKQDIKKHENDIEKLNVDINRLGNRRDVQNKHIDDDFAKPNGKIDEIFKQGDIGDCWLIAGINAIIDHTGGKEVIENLLEYDKNNGNVTVFLKGFNKKYTITAKEIKEFKQLSVGDGDIRAIEIAIDRYIKENAYKCESYHFDIDNNSTAFLFEALLGNSKSMNFKRALKYNVFNNNQVFVLGNIKDGEIVSANLENTDKKVMLNDHHAYSIVGVDSKYVYLKDPNQYTNIKGKITKKRIFKSAEYEEKIEPTVLKVLKQDLININPVIHTAKLN